MLPMSSQRPARVRLWAAELADSENHSSA